MLPFMSADDSTEDIIGITSSQLEMCKSPKYNKKIKLDKNNKNSLQFNTIQSKYIRRYFINDLIL